MTMACGQAFAAAPTGAEPTAITEPAIVTATARNKPSFRIANAPSLVPKARGAVNVRLHDSRRIFGRCRRRVVTRAGWHADCFVDVPDAHPEWVTLRQAARLMLGELGDCGLGNTGVRTCRDTDVRFA